MGRNVGQERRWTAVVLSPPFQTLVLLLGLVVVYWLLGLRAGEHPMAESREWQVWKATAALAVVAAAALAIRGVRHVRAEQEALELSPTQTAVYVVAGIAVVVLVLVSLQALSEQSTWPIDLMGPRLGLVTWAIGLAAVPWLVLVWFSALRLRHPPAQDLHGPLPSVCGLLRAWTMLSECVFAFASFVVIAILAAGALRAVWLTAAPADEFPESDVLLYGLYFSVLMAAITIPLVAAYRGRAYELIDAAYPPPADARVTKDWADSRARAEALLHLNVGIIRTPLTIFAIFTPLVTSALATVVPTLGG